ncbi:nucleoside hydrolase [Roseateles oligotrophus]|uniref:Nucleoside hydrolase n=1 Tax=Roseateles oligotrophus TaxID=1769250 RepID=A0ABT2YMC7_9BURK|nr:nucleoside hydrolase [Roseateles oligotrophus]MCV2371213.1 nucleoside hydrolase [Roseateles oligotrophus]
MKTSTPMPVIFDTDPGIDDAMALYLLARHPALDLRAVTTVFGNASIEVTSRNGQLLAAMFGQQVPVAAGAAGPLHAHAEREFSVHVHGDDGVGGMAALLEAEVPPLDARPAYQLICDMVNAEPGAITLIAVGPLTNLALALRHDPSIVAKVHRVIVMGGAFGTAARCGNVTPVAEANIINDPEAADLVFSADWPVVIVGLDVTHETVMSEAYLSSLQGRGGVVGDFIWKATRHYQDFYQACAGIDGIYAHDASAIAYAIEPEAFTLRSGPVRVVTDGIARGQTIQDFRKLSLAQTPWSGCPAQQVCIGVQAERVLALFEQAFDAA